MMDRAPFGLIRRIGPFLWPWLALLALAALMPMTAPLFQAWFPDNPHPLYRRASFLELTLAHAILVGVSSLVAAIIGIGAALVVTSDKGRAFLPMAGALAAIGQTFPPLAVLALAVPALGYGLAPTLVALVLYTILPILEMTIAGLENVPQGVREAARGLGFSPLGLLWRVRLPLAAPFILAGLRTALIINIGTATIGSSVGALSLGSPIIEGLSASNTAYVIQGAVIVAAFAIATDRSFAAIAALRDCRA
jgi:osmoprotectant transport system permease protein